jgi:RNA polymerase sigma-70 factor (ECF subfamily)
MTRNPDTTDLVNLASQGDRRATDELLLRHRPRLKRMVAVRLDQRLSARFDPSDIVQDVLAEATQKLRHDLPASGLPFYPWLRQLASDRLARLHRDHIHTGRRSVRREEQLEGHLPDSSVLLLADRLIGSRTSPSGQAMREERREKLRAMLDELPASEREVLVLRFLEQLSTAEVAEILGTTPAAIKSRQFRAVQRLNQLLQEHRSGP